MKVETEGLLSIGRFARWSGLTVKALRHYDDIGLLRPAHVDDWTGYRWYEPAQIRDALVVRRLRALRVPLDRIADLVHADAHHIFLRADVPAVGGVLGVEVGERAPVTVLFAVAVDLKPLLDPLVEFFTRQ
jgi:hypothetical protein